MAGTLHRVKRSQPKISANLASCGVLGALLPHAQQATAGRGRQSFPTTDRHPDRHPRCLLLPPTVSHGSRDTALGAGEIHKPLQCDIMDRMEGMPFLRLMEGNFARVMDQEVLSV